MSTASYIESRLRELANPETAVEMTRFFKTGPGDYGEGDIFIGVKNPQVRQVVKEVWRTTHLNDAEQLVKNEVHEVRLCGLLIMVDHYLKAMRSGDKNLMEDIFRRYTSLHHHINNWDLVDLSAIKIVGNHEWLNPQTTLMDEWIEAEGHTMWQQRIAMVSTWMLTKNGAPDKCFSRAAKLMSSRHDLLHKASGWMLREAWKRGYKAEVREFLSANANRMAAVTLSYACEQMDADERKEWQRKRKSGL